ncbi:MAG: Sensor protein KdpD [Candidatus Heimdallarchaeota archaeon LC_3]|nr:MAG: Sensor protein KdpD [Candidatus Heimdallarchaeota archaeon LC_3]
MIGLLILIGQIIIFSFFGILFYSLRNRFSLIPFYLYLGSLEVFTFLMGSVYILDIGWGITITGGNIVYSATVWCVLLLYIMERDADLIKFYIYSLIAIQIFFVVLLPFYSFVLASETSISFLNIPSELFNISFGILIVGSLLRILELFFMVIILEKIRDKSPKIPWLVKTMGIYVIILLIDGIFFPILVFPFIEAILVVGGINSIIHKFLLGILFSITLGIAILILNPDMSTLASKPDIRLQDLYSAPKKQLLKELKITKETQQQTQLLLNLLSHDMKNYLFIIKGNAEILHIKTSEEDAKQIESISAISRSVSLSNQLLDNAINLSKLQGGLLSKRNVDLGELFYKAYNEMVDLYKDVNVEVINADELKYKFVNAHPIVEDIFRNILTNSVKYKKQDQKKVILTLQILASPKSYEIIISDNCRGIPDNQKESVFTSFAKKDQTRGIGLSIVKMIMNYFKGNIWITNLEEYPEDYMRGTAVHLSFTRNDGLRKINK